MSEPDFISRIKESQDNFLKKSLIETKVTRNSGNWKDHMPFFDSRMYRIIESDMFSFDASSLNTQYFYPHFNYGSYVTDYYESVGSIDKTLEELTEDKETETTKKQKELLKKRREGIINYNKAYWDSNLAPKSFIHPYALVRLAGAVGTANTVERNLTYDKYNERKFYEIDGDNTYAGNYSKNPTTTKLIEWGNESPRGRTPYSFQDFVFCKWWNKIENNRLITLRRYASPVTDNIEFADYDTSEETQNKNSNTDASVNPFDGSKIKGRKSTEPWAPLATAVTYFGEGTGNDLSEILSFNAQYNWEEKTSEETPIDITSTQNDAGNGLVGDSLSGLMGGLGDIAQVLGFLGEATGGKGINLEGAPANTPPDPYKDGPYENRILGPVNVIMNTYRRKRGLKFKQDGLKITFEYVARPIAGINNKAVLLDLMSNILLLTYSSGTWFGGMWRYRAESIATYPWKYGDSMNALYKGRLIGKNSFASTMTQHLTGVVKNDMLGAFLPDAMKAISNLFKGAINLVTGMVTGDTNKKEEGKNKLAAAFGSNIGTAVQKVVAAKVLKGATIPYIKNQRSLLTGEPVGDWHLTIGNPFNPIAMIGNLIVKDVKFTFDKELGPDDFPTGFKAVVSLDHGIGRDRDAIESMFNRGFGRIYTLSSKFRSSADGETKVDANTGGVNSESGRTRYEETRNTYFGGGTRFIAKTEHHALANTGAMYTGGTLEYKSLSLKKENQGNGVIMSTYRLTPWQAGYTL